MLLLRCSPIRPQCTEPQDQPGVPGRPRVRPWSGSGCPRSRQVCCRSLAPRAQAEFPALDEDEQADAVSNGRRGRWRDHRQVIDGILHRVRTGVQWRDLIGRTGLSRRRRAAASGAGRRSGTAGRTSGGLGCEAVPSPGRRGRGVVPAAASPRALFGRTGTVRSGRTAQTGRSLTVDNWPLLLPMITRKCSIGAHGHAEVLAKLRNLQPEDVRRGCPATRGADPRTAPPHQ